MNELTTIQPHEAQHLRQSTDAAGHCGPFVKQTAKSISGRRYVSVEGWQAIAIAHGCTASADHVERVNDEGMSGFKCTGYVRRMSDGAEISRAEGFLGDDENTWSRRPVYARRAMVQTRAISRACRSAFAHVVVMIDAGLSTTPAEEVPHDGFDGPTIDAAANDAPVQRDEPAPREKLYGRHSSKSALATALQAYGFKVGLATTAAELEKLLEEYAEDLEQGRRYLPKWMKGDPAQDSKGLTKLTEERRTFLELLDRMRMNQTAQALSSWLGAYSTEIEALDDAQGREFEKALAEHEAGLRTVATVTAG